MSKNNTIWYDWNCSSGFEILNSDNYKSSLFENNVVKEVEYKERFELLTFHCPCNVIRTSFE